MKTRRGACFCVEFLEGLSESPQCGGFGHFPFDNAPKCQHHNHKCCSVMILLMYGCSMGQAVEKKMTKLSLKRRSMSWVLCSLFLAKPLLKICTFARTQNALRIPTGRCQENS